MDQDVSSKHVADLRSRREETPFVAMLLALTAGAELAAIAIAAVGC
jgi:hypothetical protein